MAASQQKKLTANLYSRNDTWQYYIFYRDASNKRRQKWVDTKLPIRGNKRKAEKMEEAILAEWEPKLLKLSQSDTAQMADIEVICCGGSIALTNAVYAHESVSPFIPQDAGSENYEKTLFSDYMLVWLESAKSYLQVSTYAEYSRVIKKHICPYFQETEIYLEDLKPADIKRYYDYLQTTKSPNTVLKFHANIHKALETAVEDDDIRIIANPARRVKLPQKVKFISEVYGKEDLMKLFQIIKDDYMFLIILMDATYGLRRSELVGIKWNAIDFGRKTLTVKASAVYCKVDGEYLTVVKPVLKNKSSYRTFPLTPEVEAALNAEKERQRRNRKKYKSKYNKQFSEFVFVNDIGELRKPNTVSQRFSRNILKRHNLKQIRFHDLRHAYVKHRQTNNPLLQYCSNGLFIYHMLFNFIIIAGNSSNDFIMESGTYFSFSQ